MPLPNATPMVPAAAKLMMPARPPASPSGSQGPRSQGPRAALDPARVSHRYRALVLATHPDQTPRRDHASAARSAPVARHAAPTAPPQPRAARLSPLQLGHLLPLVLHLLLRPPLAPGHPRRQLQRRPLHLPPQSPPPPVPSAAAAGAVPILAREPRKPSFGSRKVSLGAASAVSSSAPTGRRRGSSTTSIGSTASSNAVVTDAAAPPALPDYALAAAAKNP
ncbi:hypothetical protein ACCO45_000116 [Purpureocillium lilacinum]|uniref:Uncharacterized protein n=1 Tax=Purpureocillium lilacinum TaxID=33203 RepID=A0ACC4E3C1_PURLI